MGGWNEGKGPLKIQKDLFLIFAHHLSLSNYFVPGPNYATEESRSEESIYNPSTLIYSVELVAIILTTIIGILVNGLLGNYSAHFHSKFINDVTQQGGE